MTSARGSLRTALPAAAVLLVLSGCGSNADLSTNRPDVTASPPPNGNHAEPADSASKKAKPHHTSKAKVASKPKPHRTVARADGWQRMTDTVTGIAFELPTVVTPVSQTVTSAGRSLPFRMYVSPTPNGLQAAVGMVELPGLPSSALGAMADSAEQQIGNAVPGATAHEESRHSITVGGHPGIEFATSIKAPQGHIYALVRVVLAPRAVVVTEAIGVSTGAPQGEVRARARKTESRIIAGLRLG